MAGGASAGSSRAFRLDPSNLPLRYSAVLGGAAQAAIMLDREHAIVRRQGRTGVPITLDLPLTSYEGVAVRMEPVDNAGAIRVFVELRHSDPGLTLPLIMADEPEEVAADWQAWGRALNLPLLVVGQDGSVMQAAGPDQRPAHGISQAAAASFLLRRTAAALPDPPEGRPAGANGTVGRTGNHRPELGP